MVYGVPPYYSLTHGQMSCQPGTEGHGQVWAQKKCKSLRNVYVHKQRILLSLTTIKYSISL